MSITNFIATVWSETLISQMNRKYIAVANCNREFEGDIKGRGDRVKICGIGDINIFDYARNTEFENPTNSKVKSVYVHKQLKKILELQQQLIWKKFVM